MFKKTAVFLFTAAAALSASFAAAESNAACFAQCQKEYSRCLNGHTSPHVCTLKIEVCREDCYGS